MRVRKALNHVVNKEELLRYAFKGNAVEMRGVLSEKAGVDLSATEPYAWNIPKARALMKEAGYGDGFKMKVFFDPKDYVTAQVLRRFYQLLGIEIEMAAIDHDWLTRHVAYPNTREGYSFEDEDWWMIIMSIPCDVPEAMGGMFEWCFHSGAA